MNTKKLTEKIDLEVGGLRVCLLVASLKWKKFLLEKYREFITPQNKRLKGSILSFKLYPGPNKKEFEIKLEKKEGNFYVASKVYFPKTAYLFRRFNYLFKAVYSRFILRNSGFLLHASSLVKNNKAYIFSGNREAGKSTIIKLFPELKPLNDDYAIIRKLGNKFVIFSSPFYEKNKIEPSNVSKEIDSVYFLHQSQNNHLEKISPREALNFLFPKVLTLPLNSLMYQGKFHPENKNLQELLTLIEGYCYSFVNHQDSYKLFFQKNRKFWRLIDEVR